MTFSSHKFKTIGLSNNNKNQYKWKEMYNMLKMNCDFGLFSFLGEFVHGLSTSNIVFETDTICFEPIYGTSIALLGRLNDFINAYYEMDIPKFREKMISGLVDKGMPNHYVEYLIMKANSNQ